MPTTARQKSARKQDAQPRIGATLKPVPPTTRKQRLFLVLAAALLVAWLTALVWLAFVAG